LLNILTTRSLSDLAKHLIELDNNHKHPHPLT
jgi:hypothetical protein